LNLRFFVNKFDKRLKHNLEYFELIKSEVHDTLMETIVRTDAEISKSQSENMNIFDFNEKSKSVEDYLSLAKEIVKGGL
ncbi:MAG: hypothetical protein JXL97_08395, partial [Bacteroidales bacterium]|nr:hypothetical protein [Bacteroidales bacterium]